MKMITMTTMMTINPTSDIGASPNANNRTTSTSTMIRMAAIAFLLLVDVVDTSLPYCIASQNKVLITI
jgi:hypothetical protein